MQNQGPISEPRSDVSSEASQAQGTDAPPPGGSQRANHSAMMFVFLVMFIDLLGFGIVLPLLPLYAEAFIAPLFPAKDPSQVSGVGGLLLGLLLSSFSLMQFLVAPIWGRLSDRHGRRPFLLLGLAGSVFSYLLFGFASDWGAAEGRAAIGLILLFVARIGAGIAGATVSTAQAVIADVTTPERRSRGMALIGAAFGLGFTFGPALAALCQWLFPGFRGLPGYVAAAFSLGGLILGLLAMPETRRPGATAGHRGWLRMGSLRLALQTPTVGTLILIFFFCVFAFGNFEATLALSIKDVLNFKRQDNSLVFVYVGVVLMLAQGGLYQVLAKRGVSEIRFMVMGVTLLIFGLAGLGAVTAWTTLQNVRGGGPVLSGFLTAATVAVVGFAFVTPSVQALISRRSDPEKQGEILGVNQSVNALARILGPAAGPSLYYLWATHLLPYSLAVALLLVAMSLMVRVQRA